MQLFAKQLRQVNRLSHNQAKSTRLAVKQHCNEAIKAVMKNKKLSEASKLLVIRANKNIISSF